MARRYDKIDLEKIKKVLVIRLDRVGDLILSTPFLKNLRKSLPFADIAVAVREYTKDVLKNNPDINEIIVLSEKLSERDCREFVHSVIKNRYDMVISLSPMSLSYRFAAYSKASVRAAYVYSDKVFPRFFTSLTLTHCPVIDLRKSIRAGEPVIHEVLQGFELLKVLGLSCEEFPLAVYPDGAEGLKQEQDLIGIHLSQKWFVCGWETNDFKTLLNTLAEKLPDTRFLVTFGPLEKELALQFDFENKRICLKGDLDFSQWATEIGRTSLFISTDTGALHCAVAMKVPVVAVYEGDTFLHCSTQWAPWKSESVIIKKEAPKKTIDIIVEKTIELYKNKREVR